MKSARYHHEKGNIPDSLTNLPFFGHLKRSCLDEVLHYASILQVEPGQAVLTEGVRTDALYFLLKGSLRVERNRVPVAELTEPGELFGELTYISNQPHGATVRATTRSTIFKIDTALRESLAEEHLDHFERVLYRFLAQLLAARLMKSSGSSTSRAAEPDVYYL